MVRDNEKVWLDMEIVFCIMNNFSSFAKCTLAQIILSFEYSLGFKYCGTNILCTSKNSSREETD